MSEIGARTTVLEASGLSVEFLIRGAWHRVVDDVDLTLRRGETVGLVGESGSGKTVTTLALMGLIPTLGGRVSGEVRIEGEELLGAKERQWRDVRGSRIAMVFQQAVRSLNPAFTVGDQIAEVLRRHEGLGRREAWRRAVEMLDRVHIPDAAHRAKQHPHTFSGGMAQRAAIAMALVGNPEILIADEPTTALDVTVQKVILDLLRELQAETGVTILFITHDLGVVAEMCDRAAVMYAGQIVEAAPVGDLFGSPRHPYTAGLLASVPQVGDRKHLGFIRGVVPAPEEFPLSCRFADRCDHVRPACRAGVIPLVTDADGRVHRCTRAPELDLAPTDEATA